MKRIVLLTILALIQFSVISSISFAETAYTNSEILVSAGWVEKQLENPSFILIDVREEGYEDGHIPGAKHFNMDLLIDKRHAIEGHLINKEVFEKQMSEIGIRRDAQVVIYDKGKDTNATRLFYALEYYGHPHVKIINGGYAAWEAEGKITTTEEPKVVHSEYVAEEKSELMVSKQEVKSAINKKGIVLLDVRSPAEYKGEEVRAKRGGHIPSAINLEWKKVLSEGKVPLFKSEKDLLSILESMGVTKDKKIMIYCQKANRASHMYFTLRLLGYGNISVYEGSWEEWGNDPKTPIVNPSKIDRDLRSL